MRIISIDPGYDRVGIAIIEKIGGKKEDLLYSNCFRTSSKESISKRTAVIGEEVARLIEEYSPSILAIETLFMTNNQKTVMGVSEARGVIMYEGIRKNLTIVEYNPNQIKIAVTGYGKATKEQVHKMVAKLIQLPQKKMIDDEVDAIAVGITAFAHHRP